MGTASYYFTEEDKYSLENGKSIPLILDINLRKCILNIKNDTDYKCFFYCVNAWYKITNGKLTNEQKRKLNRPSNYNDNDLYLYNETATGRVGVNQYTPGGISTFTVALLTDPKANFDLYVSPNGTDSLIPDKGSGNILNPFNTINYAITSNFC
jgi:hypothetical protein